MIRAYGAAIGICIVELNLDNKIRKLKKVMCFEVHKIELRNLAIPEEEMHLFAFSPACHYAWV